MNRVLVEKRPAGTTSPAAPAPGVPRLVAWAVLAGAGLTVLALAAMLLRRLPTGSRLAGWTYPYDRAAGSGTSCGPRSSSRRPCSGCCGCRGGCPRASTRPWSRGGSSR
ncbi:hypothetical protein ACFQZ4_35815 [Catellatospora coxensis]